MCHLQNINNTHYQKKKRIRIGFIKNLASDIQPVLKVSGAKCFITSVKIISTELHTVPVIITDFNF
jgi:hypothetical protein